MSTPGASVKFRATRADLAAAVGDAARSLPSRPTVPVLNTVRLTASEENGEVEVVGYDFDVCIRATLPAVVAQSGVVCVPGRVFAAHLAAMAHGFVDVEQVGARLEMKMPRVRYGLHTVAAEDYPGLPPIPEQIGTFDAGDLARAVARAAVAARPIPGLGFSGAVYLEATSEGLTLAATDRYTIAVVRAGWADGGEDADAVGLVSAKALADALKGMAGEVTLCMDGGGLGVLGVERTFTSRRLDFEFPRWQAIVEGLPEPTTTLRVNADELAAAMGRAGRVVASSHAPVRLDITPGEGVAYGAASDGESDLDGEVEVHEVVGDPVVVGVNPLFLADALKAVGSESADVEIAIRGPRKPLTVTAASAPGDVHVVMPVVLPS